MTAERWQQIKDVLADALDQPPGRRTAFLDEACADDPALRDEVQALLEAHDQPDHPLDTLAEDLIQPLLTPLRTTPSQPERIGTYEVQGELGRGGMGVVYEAYDPRLERSVALKLLPPLLSRHADARTRFLAEARAASALDHPHICTIYEAGTTDDGHLFIAMACYEGRTLKERLKEGPPALDEAVRITRQTAEGLACAHAAGIVHRDIKPANLMLTEQGLVKILDFGVAKLEGRTDLTQSGARIGTLAYMAPEQLRGEPVDARTDLWALGVVLYEMLAGRRPFQADTEAALLYTILETDPPAIAPDHPGVPDRLAHLVERLLAKAPADRPANAAAVLEALRGWEAPGRPAPEVPALTRTPLPAPLTSFIGRQEEIDALTALLRRARLVTLTGPGGSGKTRLALHVARQVAPSFADGAAFVNLAAVRDPALVPSTIAHALGLGTASTLPALRQVKQALADRSLLLVLDNFEQVSAAAATVTGLLEAGPALTILVTSRTPLRLSGEHEFPVPPFRLPDPVATSPAALRQTAAVQLFIERARSVRPDFAPRDDEIRTIAELCLRLDGLPLAIELAAARIKLFHPAALLARLERRLDLLKDGARDRPSRHQTLRQAVAWSYDLLTPEQQRLFRRLAVFVGGCTWDVADALCQDLPVDAVDGVSDLVDHSLMYRDDSDDAEPRFTMLETIRAFGFERLADAGEMADAWQRHMAYMLDLAERAAPAMTGPEQVVWFDRLEAEHDNLRAALAWAEAEQETDVGLRLGAALWRFWLARGHVLEGCQWLRRLLALPDADASRAARAQALNGLGTLAHNLGQNLDARDVLEESLALWRQLDDRPGTAAVLNNLAWVACEISDLDRAQTLAEEALRLCQDLGELRGRALALNNLGWVAFYRGNARAARRFHQASLALRRALNDQRGIAFALVNLAHAARYQGAHAEAAAHLDEAEPLIAAVRDGLLRTWAQTARASLAADRGAYAEADTILRDGLGRWREGDNRSLRGFLLHLLGPVVLAQGDPRQARALLDQGLATWEAIGCPWGIAVAHGGLGEVARAEGRLDEAYDAFRESLIIRQRLRDAWGRAASLEGLAHVAAQHGHPERAVRCLAAATAIREGTAIPAPPVRQTDLDALRTRLQNRLDATAFAEAEAAGRRLAAPDADLLPALG